MNINFTGLKNIGYLNIKFATGSSEEDESNFKQIYDTKNLTVQLKDDYYGKDLTEFKKALLSSDLVGAQNPIGYDFLNISIESEEYQDDLYKDSAVSFYINGNELEVNDKNLRLFSFVSKLLKRISQTSEEKLVYNRDFVNEEEADSAIVVGDNLMNIFGQNYLAVKKDVYSAKRAIQGSGIMFDEIQNTMMDYFA